jgi:GTPase
LPPQDLDEFRSLVTSLGAEIVAEMDSRRDIPDSKYFIGQGKLVEIQNEILATKANVVMFNHDLTPTQERNLENFFGLPAFDRTQIILDIFAKRARSFEGKLQVELARLQHLSTRLVRGWTHLERQRGGIGLRGGPGETQLEVDRRILRNKVTSLKKRLAKLEKQRSQNRRARKRANIPTIALVGYTNAGKSTLFNKLTQSKADVADLAFTTLDPLLRRVYVPDFGTLIIVDTVGFVRDLPHELIEAFHATLEETKEADLLLHVIDASDPQKAIKIEVVEKVLEELGAGAIPKLQVFNKIDLCHEFLPRIDLDSNDVSQKVWLSVRDNLGINLLFDAIQNKLKGADTI